MTRLELLVEEWFEEVEAWKRVETRMLRTMGVMASLNKEIYDECQKQGIDIETLNLSKHDNR